MQGTPTEVYPIKEKVSIYKVLSGVRHKVVSVNRDQNKVNNLIKHI